MKNYRAIFFDWDGTAVRSRKDPVEDIVSVMKPLLKSGIKLIIVSGTTYENIASGRLHEYFTHEELNNLYLGLGRGAYNYSFLNGEPVIFKNAVPTDELLEYIHKIAFDTHTVLKFKYGLNTDIVFSRPNYCKVDLMVDNIRGENLFLQENEIDILKNLLKQHNIENLGKLIEISKQIGRKYNLDVYPTCDAKYLEIGTTSKSDNVNTIFEKLNSEYKINADECCFWGDEYIAVDDGVYGSDYSMYTEKTKDGDFFDVSDVKGERPQDVKQIGGGVDTFINFLHKLDKHS